MLSEGEAWKVAKAYAAEASATSPQVVAVVLNGSLAAGDYLPGRSDIDTAVVLTDDASIELTARLERLAADYAERFSVPKGLGVVPIRTEQLTAPPDPAEELAPELLDLTERGRVLSGELDLGAVRVPTADDLRAYCGVFIPWLRDFRRTQGPDSLDAAVNSVLYELRLVVLAHTERYPLRKPTIVPALLAADPAMPERAGLERLHAYVVDRQPPPGADWIDALHDRVEAYTTRVACWAFDGG